jgi:hypothetical protein
MFRWRARPPERRAGSTACFLPLDRMTDKHIAAQSAQSNTEKDPADWVTGDEPMTGAQRSYLKTLSEEAKVDFDETLSKAEASRRIEALQKQTGRGQPAAGGTGAEPAAPASAPSPADATGGAPVDELDFDGNGSRG